MAFNISSFVANFQGSGARPTLFQVSLNFPVAALNLVAGRLLTFQAFATSIPTSQLGQIPYNYFGRAVNFPGDRTFNPWQLNVYVDEDYAVRRGFETWSNAINGHVSNIRNPIAAIPTGYKVDGIVQQMSKIGGPVIATYRMAGCWPMNIGDIQLDWSAKDQIETFPVILSIDWWESIATDQSSPLSTLENIAESVISEF